jgi:tRNA (mo5U34)-methyltransferase
VPAQTEDLGAAVAEINWYHSIELPGGIVTPGHFDLRRSRDVVPMPHSLAGLRCLDVGTWDGFWAFEMERRGAESVTAIDIDDPDRWDWPPAVRGTGAHEGARTVLEGFKAKARGFDFARRALGSKADRLDVSVYDLDPDVHGAFDFVFLGSLLLHLRDPVGALASLRSVCAGEAVIADTIEVVPSLLRRRTPTVRLEGCDRPWWWLPNVAAFHRMVISAGFEIVERSGIYFVGFGPAHPRGGRRPPLRSLRSAAGREEWIGHWRGGVPHAAVRARCGGPAKAPVSRA